MNGMDEWQAIQNEKIRLMETISAAVADKEAEIARLRNAENSMSAIIAEALALADKLAKLPMHCQDHQGHEDRFVELPDDMRVDLFSVLRRLAGASVKDRPGMGAT